MSSCSTTDSIITTEVVPEVLPPGSRTEDAIIGATSATSIGNYDSDDDDLPPLLLVESDNDDSEFSLMGSVVKARMQYHLWAIPTRT